MSSEYQDYAIEKPKATLFDLLSSNEKFCIEDEFLMKQAFRLAGSRFEVFDDQTRDLVVPYGEGRSLIAELTGQRDPTPAFLKTWNKKVRPYTVAVQEWQLKELGNAVTEYAGVVVLADGFYDRETGWTMRSGATEFLEV